MTRTAANASAVSRQRVARHASARPGAPAAVCAAALAKHFAAVPVRPIPERLFRGVTGTGGIFSFSR